VTPVRRLLAAADALERNHDLTTVIEVEELAPLLVAVLRAEALHAEQKSDRYPKDSTCLLISGQILAGAA
jgi:hypothetical protein